jgi:hypothetical protein
MHSILFLNASYPLTQSQCGFGNPLLFKSNLLLGEHSLLGPMSDLFTKSKLPSNPAINQSASYQSVSHATALRFGKTYLKTDELRQYMGSIRNKDIEGYERHIVKLLKMGGTYGSTADAKVQAEQSFKELLGKLLIEDKDDEYETRWQDFLILNQQEQQQDRSAGLEPFVHKQYPYQPANELTPAQPKPDKSDSAASFANVQRQIFTALKAKNQSAARRAFMELAGNNRYKTGFDQLWEDYQKNPDQITCVIPYLQPRTLFIQRQNFFEARINEHLIHMLSQFRRKHQFEAQKALHESKQAETEAKRACAKAHSIYKMLEGDGYQMQNWQRLLEAFKAEKQVQNIGRFRNIEIWR